MWWCVPATLELPYLELAEIPEIPEIPEIGTWITLDYLGLPWITLDYLGLPWIGQVHIVKPANDTASNTANNTSNSPTNNNYIGTFSRCYVHKVYVSDAGKTWSI